MCLPFFRWDNLYNPRLHAIVIDLVNKLLEVTELIHRLKTPLILSGQTQCELPYGRLIRKIN